jgi:hypothetical protein
MVDDPHTDPATQGTFQAVDDLRKFDFVDRDIDGPARALRALDEGEQLFAQPPGQPTPGLFVARRIGVGIPEPTGIGLARRGGPVEDHLMQSVQGFRLQAHLAAPN